MCPPHETYRSTQGMTVQYEITRYSPDGFEARWDGFCEKAGASWLHYQDHLAYRRSYSGDRLVADESFLLGREKEDAAACNVFVEQSGDAKTLTFSGGFLPAPLVSPDLRGKALQRATAACFDEVDRIADRHGATLCMFETVPQSTVFDHNIFIQFGYLASTANTLLLDLAEPEATLWSRLRKSYKAIINKGVRDHEIVIMDSANADRDIHEAYRELHHLAAGRVTRPRETFDLMFDSLVRDRAMLVGIRIDGVFAAISYFFHDQGTATYASAADDPAFSETLPLGHIILWTAVKYYRQRGMKLFELGRQPLSGQLFEGTTPKERTIAFFKRGFGGRQAPLFQGVKYFDPRVMADDLAARMERLIKEHFDDAG